MLKKSWSLMFSILFLGILTLSVTGITKIQAQKKSLNITESNSAVENLPEFKSILNLQTTLRTIASNITPGVVSIDVEGTRISPNNMTQDPFFQFFFGNSERLQRQYSSVGSGFLITPDGYLFSNWHVVQDASKIRVTLADGRSFEAQLIGADTELDIALLKIDGNNLPVVPLGDADQTYVGDFVVAIGNPFGLSSTFTFGTVSGLGREGVLPGLQRFIQSDVAVNPGNSGGPLLNIKGQAIGINTAIRSRSGGYEGISFAIPINTARDIAEQLFSSGTIERGFLGIIPQELDAVTRRSLKLQPSEGVLVSSLETRGPAETSGLTQGDIITKIDNKTVSSPAQLTELIASKAPKTSVEAEILRNGKRQTLIITLGNRPSALVRGNEIESEKSNIPSNDVIFKGVVFGKARAEDLKRNGAPNGVVVKKVDADSPFAFILSTGDIVGAINNFSISTIEEFKKVTENNQNTTSFAFAIYRNGFLVYRSIEY